MSAVPPWLERAERMYPTWPRCPACGQAPALRTIFPDDPAGRWGECYDRFHAYPWLLEPVGGEHAG